MKGYSPVIRFEGTLKLGEIRVGRVDRRNDDTSIPDLRRLSPNLTVPAWLLNAAVQESGETNATFPMHGQPLD
jgi:hypothetical protein